MSAPLPPPAAVVDARGHRCPIPTLRLRRMLERVDPGEAVELLADDPMARIDVPHFAAQAGHVVLAQGERDGALWFIVARSGAAPTD